MPRKEVRGATLALLEAGAHGAIPPCPRRRACEATLRTEGRAAGLDGRRADAHAARLIAREAIGAAMAATARRAGLHRLQTEARPAMRPLLVAEVHEARLHRLRMKPCEAILTQDAAAEAALATGVEAPRLHLRKTAPRLVRPHLPRTGMRGRTPHLHGPEARAAMLVAGATAGAVADVLAVAVISHQAGEAAVAAKVAEILY